MKTYNKTNRQIFNIIFLFLLVQCTARQDKSSHKEPTTKPMETPTDIHSYAQPDKAIVKHLDLDLLVDFDSNTLAGTAQLTIERFNNADTLILDSRALTIQSVSDGVSEALLPYKLDKEDKFLGSALTIKLNPDTKVVKIMYHTSKDAQALQWLNQMQTLDKKSKFLFTQSQAILARTWIPLQDSPGIRFTYSAKITVPKGTLALMSAENPVVKNDSGIYTFTMPQPIPAYLMALTAGDIEFRSLGKRSGVYSEPGMLDKAAYEFADIEKMITAAEELYGPYKWGRYDVIVLPPSFPFGGMENPRLTFATPTIIVGDRSLTSLIAHELAHSWSGNLVTNETWNDFWLNEGFTVYFENRIMEKIYGKDYSDMLVYQGVQTLMDEVKEMGPTNPDTRLMLDLKGRDPDDGVTSIAYEKGYMFLRNIEETVGRETWDNFVKQYFHQFQFKSMNTKKFVEYLDQQLIKGDKKIAEKINTNGWIYQPGIPSNHPQVTSDRFEKIKAQEKDWITSSSNKDLNTSLWTSHEWVYFITHLPEKLYLTKIKSLDTSFGLTHSKNAEIQFAWYLFSIKNNYTEINQPMRAFLTTVGRRKFILPLYKELSKTAKGKAMAIDIYKEARPGYHFVARNTLDELLK